MTLAPPLILPDEFNAAVYFIDRHIAEGRGAKVAIECGDIQVTYRELFERVNQVGNGLRSLGVRIEERVLLLLLDTPEFAVSFFGAIKIGAVPVPVNTLLKPADYAYLLNNSRARVAIVSESLLSLIDATPRHQLRYLETIVVVGDEPGAGTVTFEELTHKSSATLDPQPTCKDDAAFWLYSSGSTGPPKACVHLQHDMVVSAERYAQGILNISENDRCFSVAKLFFAYGLGNGLYFSLAVGATSILLPGPPRPQNIFEVIERHRPTLFFSVPSNYAKLLSHPPPGGEFVLSSLRHAISAGEALPATVFHRFKARFGIEILDAIGSTEALHMVISNRPGAVRPGSSGTVIPGFDARIVDDNNREVPQGNIGNLVVRADSVCACYWNQHEKTKDTIEGHWIRTGDKYHQDEDGYFWYAGRSDDMLKVSGVWISPIEIESVLIEHPAVQEAVVVARTDQNGLTTPVACVVLRGGFPGTTELSLELQDFVISRLPAFKRPHAVEFFQEFPKTATGKLQRFKLREGR
ncbi:MAG TPA: benzoate-CoA ligase family protein [Candidatus Acidoferrales bacterium]|nr:benzoate-CoA ligase family protein [Candidatus Acidoferrales bacterium]